MVRMQNFHPCMKIVEIKLPGYGGVYHLGFHGCWNDHVKVVTDFSYGTLAEENRLVHAMEVKLGCVMMVKDVHAMVKEVPHVVAINDHATVVKVFHAMVVKVFHATVENPAYATGVNVVRATVENVFREVEVNVAHAMEVNAVHAMVVKADHATVVKVSHTMEEKAVHAKVVNASLRDTDIDQGMEVHAVLAILFCGL